MPERRRLTHAERRTRRRAMADSVDRRRSEPGAVEFVADRFGVTAGTVWAACREFGVEVGRRPTTAERTLAILATLMNTRCTLAEAARRHGVTKQRVCEVERAARAAGIPGVPERGGRGVAIRLGATG